MCARRSACCPAASETVLYVEDEITVRSLTAHVLRRLGYTVLEAGSGEQAREVVQEQNGPRSICSSPTWCCRTAGGKELADWVCARDGETKLLFTSGYVDENVLRHHGVSPEMAFLRKPFSPGDLARKLREVMDEACLPVA